MKLSVLVAIAVALSVAAFTFAATDKDAEKAPPAPTTQKSPTTQPVNKFCAVQQSDPVDPKVPTVVYKGKVIGFCCPDCIPDFQKDPEKYMKTLK